MKFVWRLIPCFIHAAFYQKKSTPHDDDLQTKIALKGETDMN